jgi:hypothetical protein
MNLRQHVRRYPGSPLVARRIKRLHSIGLKLILLPSMRLTQMQDLGGCRAVLNSVSDVRDVVDFYRHRSRMAHELATYDDYITAPRASGYRGAHMVFKYRTESADNRMFENLKIEMQIRSKYQHAWATAVETVGTFSRQALKSSLGSEEWRRFFALMGSVIALRERTPLVPETPTEKAELIRELREHARSLAVVQRMRSYRAAIEYVNRQSEASYYLLQLSPSEKMVSVTGFPVSEFERASVAYTEAERLARASPGADAVLVSLNSINELRRAYPNYFADTRVFIQLLVQALSGRTRGIVEPSNQLKLL